MMAVKSSLQIRPGRVEPLGNALRALSDDVYLTIDRAEPEWPVLERLARAKASAAVLACFGLALSDFQLGGGGAREYWRQVVAVIDAHGLPNTSADVLRLMTEVLARPVSARLRTMKRDRIERLLGSGLEGWLGGRSLVELGHEPMRLWHELARAMNQAPHAKTIAFSLKIFDLLHRIATGAYVDFPARVPIVADLRIARVTFSSGLLEPPNGQTVAVGMSHGGDYATAHTGDIIDAWAQVSEAADSLSLFRIDSLVWQIAEDVYRFADARAEAAHRVEAALVRVGSEQLVASRLAAELTWAM